MKKYVIIIASAFFLMACANEKRPKGIGIRDDVPVVRHPVTDTITAPSVKKDVPKKSDGRGKKEAILLVVLQDFSAKRASTSSMKRCALG